MIQNYDIFICTESKIDEFDVLSLPPGYTSFSRVRQNFAKKSGGITVIYKQSLSENIVFLNTKCEFIQWMKFKNMKTLSDTLIGGVYIPPENSKYSSKDAFDEIEEDLLSLLGSINNYALIGDFNARTKTLDDFTIPADEFVDFVNDEIDCDVREFLYDYQTLVKLNISLERVSQDKARPNTFGYKLADFCKKCNMYIVNGRIGKDKAIGKTTSNECSLIDYFIVSSKLFKNISEFEVIDFDPLLSDVHCRLHVSIQADPLSEMLTGNISSKTKTVKWKQNKREQFIENITLKLSTINDLCQEIDSFSIENHDIDGIIGKIVTFYSETAADTFGTIVEKTRNLNTILPRSSHLTKPWFNKDCDKKRKDFHKAKKRYNEMKNEDNRKELKFASKIYKQELKKSFQNYQLNLERELRQTSKHDTKAFWKILNKYNRKQKQDDPISLDMLYEHFKELNKNDENHTFELPNFQPNDYDQILNGEITENEIETVVKSLKNNKAAGYDQVLNEHIKNSVHICMPLYLKLFNFVFDTGIIPEIWSIGIVHPIYKNKGDPNDPDSYRGITLVSCLGKVYTAILNNRLNTFAEAVDLISNCQAGFRKGYSTVDNIFCLYSLIQLYLASGRKLFCTFVDFRKAFDTIWRVGLWQKMIKSKITGKIFLSIFKMYSDIKSCIMLKSGYSDFFPCQVGVRQGENLSPFLFAVFINDLEKFFEENNISCLEKINQYSLDQLGLYLKLFLLLYADDTILISESAVDMQNMLNVFEEYCDRWKLNVNLDKTKVVIFENRKHRRNFSFTFKGNELQITDSYLYLGLLFNYNCKFSLSKKKLIEQAQKAMYALYFRIRNVIIPIDLQLKLFDCLISPILLYGAEIWSYENMNAIERIHLNFLKKILKVRGSTPNYMVYGETGRYPLEITAKIKSLCLWSKLLQSENSKLSGTIYQLLYKVNKSDNKVFPWISHIKKILDDSGFSYMWSSQIPSSSEEIKIVIKQRLVDQFMQNWVSNMEHSSRGRYYLTFKSDLCLEKYLISLKKSDRHILCKFRCSNLKLPVETGRWKNIPYQNRICSLCEGNAIGDEFHYLFICSHNLINQLRQKHISSYYTVMPSVQKMKGLLSLCNKPVLNHLCIFLRKLESLLRNEL